VQLRGVRLMVVGSPKPRTVANPPKPGADSSLRVYVVSSTRQDQEPGSRRALLVRCRRLSSQIGGNRQAFNWRQLRQRGHEMDSIELKASDLGS